MENKTALTQLRDKLLVTCQELKEPSIGNEHLKGYREALKNVANDIDAQMLAIEQKQIEDAYHNAQIELFKDSIMPTLILCNGEDWANTHLEMILTDREDAEQYYSQTFKTKENERT